MDRLAECIARMAKDPEGSRAYVQGVVKELTERHPLYRYKA